MTDGHGAEIHLMQSYGPLMWQYKISMRWGSQYYQHRVTVSPMNITVYV